MDVVWEDPPPGAARGGTHGRGPSPLRKEANELFETLQDNPGRWARLWDMDTKEDARKRVSFANRKGFSMSVRQTDNGYSIFARYVGIKEEAEPEPEPEAVRQATF